MAVVLSNSSAVTVAWDQARDSDCDKLLGLQNQYGLLSAAVGGEGDVVDVRLGLDTIEIDVSVNTYGDGVVNGPVDNRLTSASLPFTAAMTGMDMSIVESGQRKITSVVSSGEIEYSGPAITAASGVKFTVPVGLSDFSDGEIDGNTLTSATGPFSQSAQGDTVVISGHGQRLITSVASQTQVLFDGQPLPWSQGTKFTLVLFEPVSDRVLLSPLNQVLAAQRQPASAAPTITRWVIGDRRATGAKRVVV